MIFSNIIDTLKKIKEAWVIHPFVFALFPFLFLFSNNLGHVYFYQIIMPATITLILTCFFFLLSIIIIKDFKKAGIIVSICLILFFSYGHIYNIIKAWQLSNDSIIHIHRYLLISWIAIFGSITIITLKQTNKLTHLTRAINFGSLLLFLNPIFLIVLYYYEIENNESKDIVDDKIYSMNTGNNNGSFFPDIYYIIPDGHASSLTLKENFNYDNSDFSNFLIDKGFYIAEKSQSNYMMTPTSLSSSLNMNYLSKDYDPNNLQIKNNKVINILKSLGYKYIHFSSGWSHTDHNILADINIKCGAMDEFIMILLPTTILRSFEEKMSFLKSARRDKLLCVFSKLSEMDKIVGPKFVFVHLETPHPPYVFGRNGEMISNTNMTMIGWHPKEAYLDQLIFTQKKLKDIINTLLNKSERNPIIIVQSDHGPATTFAHQEDPLAYQPTDKNIVERMSIINAYYLPESNCSDLLYNEISPVNSFRLIFNCYFDSKFDYLEDLSYYNWKHSNGFINVTNIVKNNR